MIKKLKKRTKKEVALATKKANSISFFCSPENTKLRAPLKRVCELLLEKCKRESALLECHLLDKSEMTKVNSLLRGKHESTNVVSVPFTPFKIGASVHSVFGELFLCPQVIKERQEDVVTLVIHGILHLEGYTHKDSHDTLLMQGREKELYAFIAQCIPGVITRCNSLVSKIIS